MRVEILTVFLTMTLTISVTRFLDFETRYWYHWAIIAYFIFSKIRFFEGDVRVTERLPVVEKDDVDPHRALGFLLGISSLFIFLVVAFHITSPVHFFGYYSLALLLDTFWIWNLREMVDPEKNRNPRNLRAIFNSWITLDIVRAVLLLIVSSVLAFSKNVTLTTWALRTGVAICFKCYCWITLGITDCTF